jgi:predicted ATPase/DNA-binding XRE family transcriptional regulator
MTRGELIEASAAPVGFGELLRRHRLAAGLTQESLAERAGLSEHGVQKLESGTTHPYRDTAERLIRALQLSDQDQARFKLAARPTPRRLHAQPNTAVTSEAASTSLPISATSFVARTGELDRLKQRFREHRLLTLTGSGGCGKTRLALEMARQLESQFINGAWLIDVSPLTDATLVAQTIAISLGIRDVQGRSTLDVLTDCLHSRHLLLIIDNCEHVIEACAQVADTLLRSCANVQILATSRELLGVAGEATWRVPSLSVVSPREGAASGSDLAVKVLASESGRLFADRAQLAVPSFALTPANASAVAQVCQRLDGIPLAIELAASWVSMLSVDQIAMRLDQRFRLLTGGNRTAVRRQQTLQATIGWSYQLLSDEERSLIRRLAVFAGGWSLDAAEALGADVLGSAEDVLQVMSRLLAKSMVLAEESRENQPSVVRYRFLETIRQYAGEKLLEAGEASTARDRHRDHFLAWAERAAPEVVGRDQLAWLARLDAEHDNLRAALEWSRGDGSDRELRLAAALAHFWLLRGHAAEGRTRLRGALERGELAPSRARAVALDWLGYLELLDGDVASARARFDQAADVSRAAGEGPVLARALRHLAEAGRAPGMQDRGACFMGGGARGRPVGRRPPRDRVHSQSVRLGDVP